MLYFEWMLTGRNNFVDEPMLDKSTGRQISERLIGKKLSAAGICSYATDPNLSVSRGEVVQQGVRLIQIRLQIQLQLHVQIRKSWSETLSNRLPVCIQERDCPTVSEAFHTPDPWSTKHVFTCCSISTFSRVHKMLTQQKFTLTLLCCLCPGCRRPPRNPSRSTWSWTPSPQGWRGSGRFQWRTLSVGQRQQRP